MPDQARFQQTAPTEGRLRWQQGRHERAAAMRQWQDAGATHLSVNTTGPAEDRRGPLGRPGYGGRGSQDGQEQCARWWTVVRSRP